MSEKRDYNNLIESFFRIVNKFSQFEKKPRDFGIGITVYPSEIHTIEIIGKNAGLNVTELARLLGITKGAVSQIVQKLVRKGLVERCKDVDNDKEVLLQLTPAGQNAFQGHEKHHARIDLFLYRKLNDMSGEQIVFLEDIFQTIEGYLDLALNDG
jgi:DNA-binding MarR family transcriptional regulator